MLLLSSMNLLKKNKELFIGFSQLFNSPWWAEITTTNPQCVYYFGPFETAREVKEAYPGYVEDLNSEGAEGIVIVIKRCKPQVLTVFTEEVN